jgi:lipoteichoic acid synthase
MEALIGYLEEAGIADDTLIVMATDHYPYGLERSATWENTSDYLRELYDVKDYDQFIRDHSALIIWSGALEDMDITVEGPVYSLDILPTVSNLMGIDYDSRLLVGRDIFSDAPALALWPDYSWKTDKGSYNFSTGTFTPAEGVQVDESYVEYVTSVVRNKITYSRSVQENNYFNYLYKLMNEPEE